MTDNEIVKALECCFNSNCSKCPAKKEYDVGYIPLCKSYLKQDTLDLINRQMAEIEQLNTKNQLSRKENK